MTKQNSLKLISIISLGGLFFSGYLSYGELFTKKCLGEGIVSCSASAPIGGIPACVFGFFMYLIVFVISLIGLKSKN